MTAPSAAPVHLPPLQPFDVAGQPRITSAQADFFRDNGLLLIRGALSAAEVEALRAATAPLVDDAIRATPGEASFAAGHGNRHDRHYQRHPVTGAITPFRIEYVIDKLEACRALLGHPALLGSVEALQGPNLVPTWDSMVFKAPGQGAPIPWHRDGAFDPAAPPEMLVFNVDISLDASDLTNCVWGVLGSHRWSAERADAEVARRNAGGAFVTEGAHPVLVQPGDVLFHEIRTLHGSKPAQSALRRVIYYEFRSGEYLRTTGLFSDEYIRRKQKVLLDAQRARARQPYARGERPFTYRPHPDFALGHLAEGEKVPSHRILQGDHSMTLPYLRTVIRNTNDGTRAKPYLRTDLNLGTLGDLPAWSEAPQGDLRTRLQAIRAAGYRGVQAGEAELPLCRELGLGCTVSGRVNKPGEIGPLARDWKQKGFECATLHVGWGHESDAEVDQLCREIIAASRDEGLPLYVETHRATITQDTWRTVQIIERWPDLRLNADFSHWYTGLEMPYGDFAEKLAFLAPALERVRFVHARCGNSSHIQVSLAHPSMGKAMEHFRELWTLAFCGFLKTAQDGDFISFNPELLPAGINYARTFQDSSGQWVEDGDRWVEALRLTAIAKECFADAERRTFGVVAAG